MTLNQIVKRIEEIALSHRLVTSFHRVADANYFLTDQQIKYPAFLIVDQGGSIDPSGRVDSYGFQAYLLDAVKLASKSMANQYEVVSDCRTTLAELLAMLNSQQYNDWKIAGGVMTPLFETQEDFLGGVMVQLTITVPFDNNFCHVPTTPVTNEGIYADQYSDQYA